MSVCTSTQRNRLNRLYNELAKLLTPRDYNSLDWSRCLVGQAAKNELAGFCFVDNILSHEDIENTFDLTSDFVDKLFGETARAEVFCGNAPTWDKAMQNFEKFLNKHGLRTAIKSRPAPKPKPISSVIHVQFSHFLGGKILKFATVDDVKAFGVLNPAYNMISITQVDTYETSVSLNA